VGGRIRSQERCGPGRVPTGEAGDTETWMRRANSDRKRAASAWLCRPQPGPSAGVTALLHGNRFMPGRWWAAKELGEYCAEVTLGQGWPVACRHAQGGKLLKRGAGLEDP
jgi:hypothetical protein